MRINLAHPVDHSVIVTLPLNTRLVDWRDLALRDPGGMHRHEVQIFESGDITYVIKELPDRLALHEYEILRRLNTAGLPTAEAVGVVSERDDCDGEGLLVTRFVDYSLPYRVLLAGRGLKIPYLGDRLLDALVGLLVRLHLSGFFWGDCSLFNTLFRRDAGALVAFVIDVETAEHHQRLSDGQRMHDVQIAVENLAGGLLDLQSAGRLDESVDPFETAAAVERRYAQLWDEVTGADVFDATQAYRIDARLRRLHDLGFDAGEVEIEELGGRLRLVPRVVEIGYYAPQLLALTGLRVGEHQARRLLGDIRSFTAALPRRHGRPIPENIGATRWLDQVYEPTVDAMPVDVAARLEPAEFFHQVLDHRWFMSETAGHDIGHQAAVESYIENGMSSTDITVTDAS